MSGHSGSVEHPPCSGEVSALATHPHLADVFATGGEDATLRLWRLPREALRVRRMAGPVHSLAFSSDGAHLSCAVKGGVSVLVADSLAEVLSFTLPPPRLPPLPHEAVSSAYALAYSPDDSLLAAGCSEGLVHILEVSEHYRPLHSCKVHAAAILHLDWSEDGRFIQSVCAKAELHFLTSTGELVTDPGSMRDVSWASYTCTLGWPIRGAYPKMSDGSDITAAHRAPNGRLFVTADEFRKLNLFRYPCGPGSAACRSVVAHASHAGCVRFTSDSKHVISVGGPDLSVVVWRVA